jgi:ComF family protein
LCDDCFNSIKIHQTIEPFDHPLKYLDGIFTATDYSDKFVRTAIHYFKFRFIKELANPLAQLLIIFFEKIKINLKDPIIIPVPLNKKRFLERGFNQAELLAKIFAEHFNYLLMTDLIERSRNTPHQIGLNKERRLTNVQGAFRISPAKFIQNKNIILIDDVVTTGSTLEEMAKVLKENGASKVYGFSVAKD